MKDVGEEVLKALTGLASIRLLGNPLPSYKKYILPESTSLWSVRIILDRTSRKI
jgi:hypothetical protein